MLGCRAATLTDDRLAQSKTILKINPSKNNQNHMISTYIQVEIIDSLSGE